MIRSTTVSLNVYYLQKWRKLTFITISIQIYSPKVCYAQGLVLHELRFRCIALQRHGGDPSGWTVPAWSLQDDKKINSDIGVGKVILSMTAPGACIERDSRAAARLARQSNEAAAAIRDSYPDTYGFFASLPSLLDTESALDEIAFALDHLRADGVILFTRYGQDNHYLGHSDFAPVWHELNHRKAVVLIHPTHAVDISLVNQHLPQPMFDYPHETGRAAIDLICSGRLKEVKDCKIILSHAGGTLPYLIYRVAGMLPHTPFTIGMSTEEIVQEAQKFYFDTALSANPYTLPLLLQLASPGHILFGSDFPNAPKEGIKYYTRFLDEYAFSDEKRREIEFEAALNLFPRFR